MYNAPMDEKKIKVTAYLPPELLDRLRAQATKQKRSLTAHIEYVLERCSLMEESHVEE